MKTLPDPHSPGRRLEAEGEHEGIPAEKINAAYLEACQDSTFRFGYQRAFCGPMPLATQFFIGQVYQKLKHGKRQADG